MDNRIFNVNGIGERILTQTIKLAFENDGFKFEKSKETKADGYFIDPQKGFVILGFIGVGDTVGIRFPVPLGYEKVAGIVYEWLQTEEAKKIPMDGWDADADHDGTNDLGWRVYCEDWGHVGTHRHALAAIKPAYMWYGR